MKPAEARRLRAAAYAATMARLRAEFAREQKDLCAAYQGRPNPSQAASVELRRRHPERAAAIYREEVLAGGLPEPVKQAGRWPS